VRCLSCKYDLSKLTEHRCPECGRAFDPNDRKTFNAGRRLLSWRRIALIAAIAYMFSLAITIYLLRIEFPNDAQILLLSPVYTALTALIFINPICLVLYLVVFGLIRTFKQARDHS
jgi:hypothetical protein